MNVWVKKAVVVACDRDGLFRLKCGLSVMGGGGSAQLNSNERFLSFSAL